MLHLHDVASDVNNTKEDFAQYVVGTFLWVYVSPVLIVVGTCGNLLSIVVLMRPRLRHSTTMFFLICLSFSDLICLYTGLLRYWVSEAFNVDVRHLSKASCKIHTFLVYLSLDFTVWILVSVTIDRCLSVSQPFKAKLCCSLTKSKWIVCLILFFLIMKNMHFLWTVTLVQTWKYSCDGTPGAVHDFLRYIWPWIDFSTFCLIPFSIMIACNIKIIHTLLVSQKRLDAHNKLYTNKTLVMDNTNQQSLYTDHHSECGIPSNTQAETLNTETTASADPGMSKPSIKSGHKISSLTVMLLTINCVFLITTAPIQVFLIGEEYWFPMKNAEEIAWHKFWWAIVNILQYINNAIHFFLYCLSGPRFRNELKSMCRRSRKVAAAS